VIAKTESIAGRIGYDFAYYDLNQSMVTEVVSPATPRNTMLLHRPSAGLSITH